MDIAHPLDVSELFLREIQDGKSRWFYLWQLLPQTAKKRTSRPITPLMELSTQRECIFHADGASLGSRFKAQWKHFILLFSGHVDLPCLLRSLWRSPWKVNALDLLVEQTTRSVGRSYKTDMFVYVSVSALLRRWKDLCFAVRKMKKVNKNACLRHGCFTYSISLDNNYLSLEPEAAYDAKSAFIQRTADDLSSESTLLRSHLYSITRLQVWRTHCRWIRTPAPHPCFLVFPRLPCRNNGTPRKFLRF